MKVCFETIANPALSEVEIVERKGVGHPDTICDALAERLSRALSEYYLDRFGEILHHNVDKALLVAGRTAPRFGGGEVLEPIDIHLAGRAVTEVGDARVPVRELAEEHARCWLEEHLRYLDVPRHVRLHVHVRPGSVDLSHLFRHPGPTQARANDTSFGVGFHPLSALERLTLSVDHEITSPSFCRAHPASGEDVKVMAVRTGSMASLTVARAFVSRHVASLDSYLAEKDALSNHIRQHAGRSLPEVKVHVNASDQPELGAIYLTVTGTSAEAGDDGQVGRGNRVNGLITPQRPMSLEAAAGKNPVSHVGKLYNLVANEVAHHLCRELADDVGYAEVLLVSRIGEPIAEPSVAQVRLALSDPTRLAQVQESALLILRDQLAGVGVLWRRVLRGDLSVY